MTIGLGGLGSKRRGSKLNKRFIKALPVIEQPFKHPVDLAISSIPSEFTALKLQAERSFKHFARQAFHVIEPGIEFIENFATDAICDHLQAIAEGLRPLDPSLLNREVAIRDILISIPPRHLKSCLTAILFPAWVWINYPYKKFLFLSYSYSLTKEHSRKCRELIKSDWYQERWGDRFTIATDSDTLQRFDNDKGGVRYATSLGSQVMGFGADIIVGDDLNDLGDIHSKTSRDAVKHLWDDVVVTRLNNMRTGAHVIIAQRCHDDDLNGHVSRKDKNFGHYIKLVIPAEFEAKFRSITYYPGTKNEFWRDPRKNEGDLICPERFGPAEIYKLKIDLGPFNVAAQLQQRPVPVEGGVFEHSWWRTYRRGSLFNPKDEASILPNPSFWNESAISCDMSFGSIKDSASYVVFQAWCKVGAKFYLLDQVRGQWRYTKAKNELRKFIRKHHQIYAVYVEDKALGPAVLEDLEEEGFPGLMPVNPKDGAVGKAADKVSRAHAVSALVAAGNVYIPDGSQPGFEWVDLEFFPEIDVFPMGVNDDQVDTATQALKLLRGSSAFGVDCDDYNGINQQADEDSDYGQQPYNANLPNYQQYGMIGAGTGGFVMGQGDSDNAFNASVAVNGMGNGAAHPTKKFEHDQRLAREQRAVEWLNGKGNNGGSGGDGNNSLGPGMGAVFAGDDLCG